MTNVTKDLAMERSFSFWTVEMGPDAITSAFIREQGEILHTHTKEKFHMKTEAEPGTMWPQSRNAQ